MEKWASLISDVALGLFALWQGIELIGERRLKALHDAEAIRSSRWYSLRKFTGWVLLVAVLGFAAAVVMKLIVLTCGSQK